MYDMRVLYLYNIFKIVTSKGSTKTKINMVAPVGTLVTMTIGYPNVIIPRIKSALMPTKRNRRNITARSP